MTQTMDLNKMGLASMSNFEMQEVDGGGFFTDYIIGKALDLVLDYVFSGGAAANLVKLGPSAMNASMMYN